MFVGFGFLFWINSIRYKRQSKEFKIPSKRFYLEKQMTDQEIPKCPHCDGEMKKWQVPENSTWGVPFLYVCFNDECPYFIRGWDHMKKTQEAHASYRHSLNPEKGSTGPLPCWNHNAHKDHIIDD
jgi:hypothetical protein